MRVFSKWICILLSLSMVLTLAACRSSEPAGTDSTTTPETEKPVVTDPTDPADPELTVETLENTYWCGIYTKDGDEKYDLPNEEQAFELFLFAGGKGRLLNWHPTLETYYSKPDCTWCVEDGKLVVHLPGLPETDDPGKNLTFRYDHELLHFTWLDTGVVFFEQRDMPLEGDEYHMADLMDTWCMTVKADEDGYWDTEDGNFHSFVRVYQSEGSILIDYDICGRKVEGIETEYLSSGVDEYGEPYPWYLVSADFTGPINNLRSFLTLRPLDKDTAEVMVYYYIDDSRLSDQSFFWREGSQTWSISSQEAVDLLNADPTIQGYLDLGAGLEDDERTVSICGVECPIIRLYKGDEEHFLAVNPSGGIYCYIPDDGSWIRAYEGFFETI